MNKPNDATVLLQEVQTELERLKVSRMLLEQLTQFLQAQLAQQETCSLNEPVWPRRNGKLTVISKMEDQHLVNAIAIVRRQDWAYFGEGESVAIKMNRIRAFEHMLQEAARRGLKV